MPLDNKLDQSRSTDYAKHDSFFKSPEPANNRLTTGSILKQSREYRNQEKSLFNRERLSESSNKFGARTQFSTNKRLSVTGNESISPKVSFTGPEVTEKN